MEKSIAELDLKLHILEENQKKMEKGQIDDKNMLIDIKADIRVIKETLISSKEQEDLKNQILHKDIEGMKERVEKLEANQRWLVLSIMAEVIGIVFGIIMIFINKGL